MPRFVVLEHTGAPNDPAGRHFDLLLEEGDACRTWRLATMPVVGGPPAVADEIASHRLAWLDHVAGNVSGDRGFARRVDHGTYEKVPLAGGPNGTTDMLLTAFGSGIPARMRLSRCGPDWQLRAE